MSESSLKADRVLDASGLVCPLPAVKTALALERMCHGEVLEIITTDEISQVDLPVWCRQTGHELLQVGDNGDSTHIFVRKQQTEK
jgi:tRNA 2-thiouridine synthesizing protein A